MYSHTAVLNLLEPSDQWQSIIVTLIITMYGNIYWSPILEWGKMCIT